MHKKDHEIKKLNEREKPFISIQIFMTKLIEYFRPFRFFLLELDPFLWEQIGYKSVPIISEFLGREIRI
jgi:hypothetical protein